MDRVIKIIDGINLRVGRVFAWLFIPLVYSLIHEIVATKVFAKPTDWAFDASYMLYGAIFMIGAAYTLAIDGHVRGDIFYRMWKPKVQATIDLILYLMVFFPAMVALLIAGSSYAYYSFSINEKSLQSPFGPIIWPLKVVIPATALLMLIQGISQVAKCIRCLKQGRWEK
ncbi:MAG: TRAP transporter small permease subunit [Thermodesulfobacteriota bacterium]|nr:TRAP transporter small permease subunit [Thermodesulfobacteriota bacterium]